MPQGRPKAIRVAGSGEKLYVALKLLGLSWGARVGANHVAANPRWAASGLPHSINTVIEDIRSGIPLNRLERYAVFFQVPAELFTKKELSPYAAEFSCAILKTRHQSYESNPTRAVLLDANILEYVRSRNTIEQNYQLYHILVGFYRILYKRSGEHKIYLGCCRTQVQTNEGICVEGATAFEGVMVPFRGILFQWQQALHLQYYSEDYQILGYLMTPNPMLSLLTRQRKPFVLHFKGLAGSMTLSPEPERFEVCAVKETEREREGIAFLNSLRPQLLQDGPLVPDDARYADALAFFS